MVRLSRRVKSQEVGRARVTVTHLQRRRSRRKEEEITEKEMNNSIVF